MGHASTVFYKRLAFLFSLRPGVSYSSVMSWIHCRISYSLLHSEIMCLRVARAVHFPLEHLTLHSGASHCLLFLVVVQHFHYFKVLGVVASGAGHPGEKNKK